MKEQIHRLGIAAMQIAAERGWGVLSCDGLIVRRDELSDRFLIFWRIGKRATLQLPVYRSAVASVPNLKPFLLWLIAHGEGVVA